MLSSVALRAQIASIIDALSKAAAAEISKVVEDDMVVLRLEMCQREGEIKKLKSDIELLHSELRAAQERATLRPDSHGRDDVSGTADDRTLLENVLADENHTGPFTSEVQIKCEPVEQEAGSQGSEEARGQPAQPGAELALYEGSGGQWRSPPQNEAAHNSSDYLSLGQSSLSCLPEASLSSGLAAPSTSSGGFPQSPLSRGLLGYSQYRNSYTAARRRTVKRLMFKKGFICPYCGKCFERSGHLERHKRIHTGEKPYRCEICGRQFNQKCSLKEHMKIHRRCIQPTPVPTPVEVQVSEQKPIPEVKPCPDPHRPEEESQVKAKDDPPNNDDVLPTPVQVKSEPAEEAISPLFHGGNEQMREAVDSDLSDRFTAFERDSQQWISRIQGQSNAEVSSIEYLNSTAQNMTSFPGMAQLLPVPVDAPCSSSFSFPGKPYGELKNSMIPQTPYGSLDTHLMSNDAALHGMAESHGLQRRSRSFQVIKPKKCFVCSYCGKVFERAGHLERHLRIHTGEKPYGCHICGRCFNQKSSLKGHMRTHRNGENSDVLEAHHMMVSLPDNQSVENLAAHKNGQPPFEEQLQGSDSVVEQTVTVKLEPDGEDFQTLSQTGSDGGTGAPDQSQLWASGMEKTSDTTEQTVCVLLGDVKYHLSPAAGASDQQGYTSPVKDLPFLDDKGKEEIMHTDEYSVMGIQSSSSAVTLTSDIQNQHVAQEVAVNDYSSVRGSTQEGAVFDFNMAALGNNENSGGRDATRQNCFICSSCGQSFDSFSFFQRHQCKSVAEQSFSCEICGKVFNQMGILKLHLKLHVEQSHL